MSSKSAEQVTDKTTNLAIDRRAVQEQGNQILDSIVYDSSPEAVQSLMRGLTASWQSSVKANSLNLLDILNLGQSVLQLADKSQIEMGKTAYQTLRNGMQQFEAMVRQGNLVVDLADNLAQKSLDTAGQAIDVVASVKTADFQSSMKTLTVAILAFSLGAIYLTRKAG